MSKSLGLRGLRVKGLGFRVEGLGLYFPEGALIQNPIYNSPDHTNR